MNGEGHEESPGISGPVACDVAIFFDSSVWHQLHKVEEILFTRHELTSSISCMNDPYADPTLTNLYSIAERPKTRVFLITDFSRLTREFSFYLRLLENPIVCSRSNSILLLNHRIPLKLVPSYLRHLPCTVLDAGFTAEDIVRDIVRFHTFRGFEGGQCQDADVRQSSISNQNTGVKECQARFKKLFGTITKKRCFVLISSPIQDGFPSLKKLTLVPWVRVYDFDEKSSTHGLLSWVQQTLHQRHFVRSTTPEEIEHIDDETINWVSMCDSGSDVPQTVGLPESAIWSHGASLVNLCIGRKIPIILVMWYSNSRELDSLLDGFLTGLRHHLNGCLQSFECIVCVSQHPNEGTPLYRTLTRLQIINNTIAVPLENICEWIGECSAPDDDQRPYPFSKYYLPKCFDRDEEIFAEIQKEDLSWIERHVHLLVKRPAISEELDCAASDINSLGISFLQGSKIHWSVLESGKYDAERDLLNSVKQYVIFNHISTRTSGIVKIVHAPGGGGTTFSRRLLHELRNETPCGELVSQTLCVTDLKDRLVFIRNSTFLPIVLLLDGHSADDAKNIFSIADDVCLIIVHVTRFTEESGNPESSDNVFFLDCKISATETDEMFKVYSREAPSKSQELEALNDDRRHDRKPHYIFEYGMTAFQSQFVGVRNYVHEYLQLCESEEPSNWQKVLVFLALANYYGHIGLPCKLFSKLFGRGDGESVDMEDLPHSARQFITDKDETWEITHYAVSKLIIEQVLVRRHTAESGCPGEGLSDEAIKKLSIWAVLFIQNVAEYITVGEVLAYHMDVILTSIFIKRNAGDDLTEIETDFAKIIEDIGTPCQQELIFQELEKCFPGQPEFAEHLGRFYTKQGNFEKADRCFKRAVEVRKNAIRRSDASMIDSIPSKPDNVLERICNVHGFACISNIRSRIGARIGELSHSSLKGKNIAELIRFCLSKAYQAIECFKNSRLHYQKSSNPSFVNLGEVKARLHISELAKVIKENNVTTLSNRPSLHSELDQFALSSLHECNRLLEECITYSSHKIPERIINDCVENFEYVFQNDTADVRIRTAKDTSLQSLKCNLSIMKSELKQNKKANAGRQNFKLSEDIRNYDDIPAIVLQYEKICDAIFQSGYATGISAYMTEWLRAIRHVRMTDHYSLTGVLARVEQWRGMNEMWSLSTFYCYVLSTTICICASTKDIANAYAEKSHKLMKHMMENDKISTCASHNAEWLGNISIDDDFNRLIHFEELGKWDGKFWIDPEQISKLQVCSGSIQYCYPYNGLILLDGANCRKIPVFFMPEEYSIGPSHSTKSTRVEFYLAFNARHFAQAYEVTVLKTYICPNPDCGFPTEISTLGKKDDEKYSTCNKCESKVVAS